jgi:hypothetical protein
MQSDERFKIENREAEAFGCGRGCSETDDEGGKREGLPEAV